MMFHVVVYVGGTCCRRVRQKNLSPLLLSWVSLTSLTDDYFVSLQDTCCKGSAAGTQIPPSPEDRGRRLDPPA